MRFDGRAIRGGGFKDDEWKEQRTARHSSGLHTDTEEERSSLRLGETYGNFNLCLIAGSPKFIQQITVVLCRTFETTENPILN